jgi:hypothetical protein
LWFLPELLSIYFAAEIINLASPHSFVTGLFKPDPKSSDTGKEITETHLKVSTPQPL